MSSHTHIASPSSHFPFGGLQEGIPGMYETLEETFANAAYASGVTETLAPPPTSTYLAGPPAAGAGAPDVPAADAEPALGIEPAAPPAPAPAPAPAAATAAPPPLAWLPGGRIIGSAPAPPPDF